MVVVAGSGETPAFDLDLNIDLFLGGYFIERLQR